MSDVFTDNPNMKSYFQTSDGTKFYDENSAKNHGKTLQDQSVEEVKRPAETEDSKSNTAKDIIAMAPEMTLEDAQEYLDTENQSEKPRATVIAALEKRINDGDIK